MANGKIVFGLATWAVLATGAAGVGWYQVHQEAAKPRTNVVVNKGAGKTTTTTSTPQDSGTSQAEKADAKELASLKASNDTITKRAKAFVTLHTQFYENARKQHDDIEAISTKKIADDLVVVPTGGMAADNFRWSTTWYNRDVQIQPENGNERQATVRVVFDLSGAGNTNPQKQDILYRFTFKDEKITEWSEYVYAEMEPGVSMNQQ
ncbi:hypothetical protein [Lacticaseibacillus sp. 866-1]|uniref:hypothetical protein n=1 Tax=Lacticaseibacillus sp. 866-1 TaxID=2799576 RepID=UPI00194126B2|nr:hypothetical protein [Lacticaseibacillus sp. 866-1]